MKITIVTPVYEDVEASAILFKELAKIPDLEFSLVAIDDGSVKNPLPIESIRASGLAGSVIKLKRNVGHQKAIALGLSYAHEHNKDSDYVVVMDSDGEDLPSTIPDLVSSIINENVDVVVARRKSRVETWKFKLFYLVYKVLFKIFAGRKISFGNFMIMTPAGLERLVNMQELWTHVAACVLASKLRVGHKSLDRGPRYAGKSKMNFVGLALHGFKAFMVFAEDVLVRVGMLCVGFLGVTVLLALLAVGLKIAGFASPGWFSIVLGILGMLFLQLGSIALMALMNLMLTGMIRNNGSVMTNYKEYIKEVLHAHAQ